MTLTGIEEWQLRRSRFNHDWLKNRFLNRLDGFLTLLSAPGAPSPLLREFLSSDLPQWEKKAPRGRDLIDSFRQEMSPSAFLSAPPLCLWPAQERHWLGSQLHALWVARYPVDEMAQTATEALEKAAAVYQRIRRHLESRAPETVQAAREIRSEFESFGESCRQLGDGLSRFPSEIQIV